MHGHIVGFHIVQREHAPVTQVARLLLQNQTKFMHDVQTEFASAFENKIDLEQAMGVETKYTFKDEVFEEMEAVYLRYLIPVMEDPEKEKQQ